MCIHARVLAEAKLLYFQIPVAKFAPDEIPERLRRFVIAVQFERAIHDFGGVRESVENPGVFNCVGCERGSCQEPIR